MSDEAKPAEVLADEGWLMEWYGFGLAQLEGYLGKHAAFDQWILEHPRPIEP